MTMADQGSRFGQPEKICDIVLKGGITSGVVYPLALVSLAEKYRFSNIGGTSAGAMAAVAASPAEDGRHISKSGFDAVAWSPDWQGPKLLPMVQPAPRAKTSVGVFRPRCKRETTAKPI